MKIVLTGLLENISTRQDGSVKLTIGSQEMDSTEAGNLFVLRNKFLKVLLSDNNISPMEETLIDEQKLKDGKKVKTKSQRLRAVLYVYAKESGKPEEEFEGFYEEQMDKFINHIKRKIDEL